MGLVADFGNPKPELVLLRSRGEDKKNLLPRRASVLGYRVYRV